MRVIGWFVCLFCAVLLVGCEIRPLDTQEVDKMAWVGEEFVLAAGETAVVRNTDLIIRNDGEGSEYYDDENGDEVHVYNIKLDVNGEVVWLDDTMPQVTIGEYMIQWQVGDRLLVTEVGEAQYEE